MGQGHHKHVQTAGKESKFGIALDLLEKVAILAEKIDTHIVGFHCHVGRFFIFSIFTFFFFLFFI